MLKLYIKAKAIAPWLPENAHVTMAYGDIQATKPIVESVCNIQDTVASVEYWIDADVTVLVLTDADGSLGFVHEYYARNGASYDRKFIPHITVSKGNEVCAWQNTVGNMVHLSGLWYQIKEVK